MLLTIQIVNYKSQENLERCLQSICQSLEDADEIQVILINNDDEKLNNFSDFEDSPLKIKLIEAGSNLGFGRAHNLGFKYAQGEYIFFLNPDTEISPGAIAELIRSFKEDSAVGIVGPLLFGESGDVEEEYCGFKKTPLALVTAKIVKRKYKFNEHENFCVDWVSGGAMMVRKKLFEEIGGFDENYFMYFEDVDLCLRAKKIGYQVLLNPKARIFHKSGQSFSDNQRKKRYYYISQDYYLRKHFGHWKAGIARILRFPFYVKNVYLNK